MADLLSTNDLTEERRRKLGDELAAWFESTIGLPTEMLFYDIAGKALAELQARANAAQKQAAMDETARRNQWLTDRNMLYAKAYLEKYGMSEQELRAAVESRLIKSETPPGRGYSFWNKAIDDRPLSTDELAQLADSVLLTANQAAERLGIDRKAFDRLKKKHNLQAAEMRRTRGSEWPFAVYKLSDIDRMKP